MTRALKMSPQARSATAALTREFGQAFRAARLANGDQQKHVAHKLGTRQAVISCFERGYNPDLLLGNIVRLFDLYNLTIVVTPKTHHAHFESHVPGADAALQCAHRRIA